MRTTKLFLMAALAMTFAACSNDDNEILAPEQPAPQAEGIPFTATISIGESAATRALKESGSTLEASWAVDEKVALIHNGIKDVMTVSTIDGDGNATITGTITSATEGAAVTIIYPSTAADGATGNVKADLLLAQEGTLADVAAKYEVRKGDGTLKVAGGSATLDGDVSLDNQFAIWKLTLSNDAKYLCIMADNAPIAGATLASEGKKEFTVAVPAVTSKTVTVVAKDESINCYYYSKGGISLAASKYYQSSLTMTQLGTSSGTSVYQIRGTSSSASIPDGKTVVLNGVTISDGNITCEGNATIILMGVNSVTCYTKAAIQAEGSAGTTLTITGTGSLTATATKKSGTTNLGAGIGSKSAGTCGDITITGGTIEATGATNAAGIGSAQFGTCGDITITGGTITAKGGDSAAGIGSGYQLDATHTSHCGNITITGGTIIATGSTDAAGIGTGMKATCSNIDISGGTTTANGGTYGAGIGNGNSGNCGTITITGGTTTATGGKWAAGIGGGWNGTCGSITITDGVTKVTATKGPDEYDKSYSIGKGSDSTCGSVTIGGTVGAIKTSPYTYKP